MCPSGWIREYYGYLMSEPRQISMRSTFECVSSAMNTIPGTSGAIGGSNFYHVEVACNNDLPCTIYDATKEVTCVVCSK